MPSRNRSAKACDPASLAPNDTASLTDDFSDMIYASLYARYVRAFCLFVAPAPGEADTIAPHRGSVQHLTRKASDIVAGGAQRGCTEGERRSRGAAPQVKKSQ